MKKRLIVLSALAAVSLMMSACGGGDGGVVPVSNTTTVTVERGPVFNATVSDAKGQRAANTPNTNRYIFNTPPTYPISASGGQVDVNYDGVINTEDVPLAVTLKTDSGFTITALTTYLADLNASQKEAFAQSLGVSLEQLYALPSDADGLVVAAINAAYAAIYTAQHDTSANMQEKFEEMFDILKQEPIAREDESSDNITKEELTDMEVWVNSTLGISYFTESDLEAFNDNVTGDDYDNVTGGDDYDNVTGGDDYDNVTGGDDYDNVTGGDDYDNVTGGDDYDNVTGSDDYDNVTGISI